MDQGKLHQEIKAILDQQDAIETASYDASIGRKAVLAARRSVEAVLGDAQRTDRQIDAIIAALEGQRERQKGSVGEFSTGAATIGSILRRVHQLRENQRSGQRWNRVALFALVVLLLFLTVTAIRI